MKIFARTRIVKEIKRGQKTITLEKVDLKKLRIRGVTFDCIAFCTSWKEVRDKARYKGFECLCCDRPFEFGEKISLIFTTEGNRVVCKACATYIDELLKGI